MGARGAAVAVVGILIASCGDDTGGSRSVSGPMGPYIEAFCHVARSCCGQSPFGNQALADCEAEYERQTHLGELIARGNITVDTAVLDACVAVLRSLAVECVASNEGRTSCSARMFRGKLAEGAACRSVIECWDGQGDWTCVKQSSSSDSLGVCRRIARGRSGDACLHTCDDEPCLTNLTTPEADPVLVVCKPSDGLFCAANVCAPLIAAGGACTDDEGCGPEQFCDGVCTPRKSENQPCADFSECASPLTCAEGRCAILPIASEKLCSGDLN